MPEPPKEQRAAQQPDSGRIIVLNGGSSSGKTSIARALQHVLPGTWLAWSIDDLVDAMPHAPASVDDGGVTFGSDGEVDVGPAFMAAMAAWRTGLAAMVRDGASIVLDDVFLAGGASQDLLRAHLDGLDVLWVGVRCDPQIAAEREAARGDRVAGMAELQAEIVHQGVSYDVEVDSGISQPSQCARTIAAALAHRGA